MNQTWRNRGRCEACGAEPQERCKSLRGSGTLKVSRPHFGRPLMSTEQIEELESARED